MRSLEPLADKPPPYASRAAVVLLCALSLLIIGQLYSMFPLLATYRQQWNIDPGVSVWFTSGFGIAYACGMLIAGPLVDKFGAGRIIIGAVLMSSAAALAVSLAPSHQLLLATRIVQGCVAAFFAPSALTYISQQMAPDKRGPALSAFVGSMLAAAVIAPMIAKPLTVVRDPAGWFLVSGVAMLLLLPVGARVILRGPGQPSRTQIPSLRRAYSQLPLLAIRPRLQLLYLATGLSMLTFVGVTALAESESVRWRDVVDDPMTALRALTLPICVIVPMMSRRLQAIPAPVRISSATGLAALTCVLAALDGGFATMAVCLATLTAMLAVSTPAIIAALAEATPDSRGAGTALFGFALFAGASLGPLAANLAPVIDLASLLSVMAVATAVAGAAFVLGHRAIHHQPQPAPNGVPDERAVFTSVAPQNTQAAPAHDHDEE